MDKIKSCLNRYEMRTITLLLFMVDILFHIVPFYRLLTNGTLYTGKGDGIAQMLPFQMYLYEKMTSFSMDYSMDFGIGGDYMKGLAYYFSTSPITYLNFILVWIGDIFLPYDTGDVVFWAKNQIFISIIKLFLILFASYKLFRYIGGGKTSSFVGSTLYGFSSVYFFFTFTWCFFSDVMLWLPITIYGLERLMRERKGWIFSLGIALTLWSNFYFSWYEFIFILSWFIYRVCYPFKDDIKKRSHKIGLTVIYGTIGFMISLPGFYRGVSSYLTNDRTLPDLNLKPIIDWLVHYNLFYDGYYVIIPFLAVPALMTFKLYRHYYFRLSATFTLIFMIGSLSPLFDSFFNGFSIDQRRWVYLLVFSTGFLISQYVRYIREIDRRTFVISMIPVVVIYPLSVKGHDVFLNWLIFVPLIVILIYIMRNNRTRILNIILIALIISMNFVMVNEYVERQIDTLHPEKERSIDFLNSSKYVSKMQKNVIDDIMKEDPTGRIDWQTSATHNTPMTEHFNGVKLYSSIFDEDIYQFYDKDLDVTMETDSNSIYYRLGERANLYNLFNVDHVIRLGDSSTIADGFVKKSSVADNDGTQYSVYENTRDMPFVRVTDQVYNYSSLKTPIDREHAMLKGVVIDGRGDDFKEGSVNLIDQLRPSMRGSALNGEKLVVNADEDGITYRVPKKTASKYKDLYVEMEIELLSPSKYHYVWLNEIYQSRKPLDDDYRRFNPKVTFKVKSSDKIELKLMSGEYRYKLTGLYGEDYKTLDKYAVNNNHTFKQNRNNLTIKLADHKAGYAVIPLPFIKGMKAEVDGEKTEIMEGNYLMTAVKVDENAKKIVITYHHPYLWLMWMFSIIGIILLMIVSRNRRVWNLINKMKGDR